MALNPGERSALQVLDAAQGALATLAEARVANKPLSVLDAMAQY